MGELYAELGIDRSQMQAGLQALKRESREAVQSVEKDAGKAGQKIPKTFGEAFKKSSGAAEGFNKTLGKLNTTVGGGAHNAGVFGRTLSFIKFPALIAGAQAAAGAVGALTVAVIQGVSAAAPLVGLYPAIGAQMLAFKQAALVAKLASHGVGEALGEISEEGEVSAETMKKLGPAVRPFVAEVQKLHPELERTREIAAAGLFPGVTDAVRNLAPLMSVVRPIIRDTAEAMGDLARQGGRMVSMWGSDIATVGQSNVRIIGNLGTAGLFLADAARHVLVEIQPLARWLSRVALHSAESVRQFFAGARASGALAEFFGRTRTVATQLGHSLLNIGAVLVNVGKAAEPFGREMFGSLEKVTGEWARFTGSVKGQNALTSFFRDAQPAIKEVGLLLRDVVKFFFDMAGSQNLGPLIKQIRTEFLPVLKQVGMSASGELLPAIVTLATQVTRLFSTFGTETGTLVGFVGILGKFLEVVQNLVGENEGMQQALVTIGAIAGVSSSLGVGQVLQYVTAWRQFRQGQQILTTIQAQNAIATGTATAATTGLSVSQRIAAVSSRVLGVAMRALPFILIAAAVVALVILIVKNWDTIKAVTLKVFGAVRDFLVTTWRTIKNTIADVVGALLAFLVRAWANFLEFFIKIAGGIIDAAAKAFGWVPKIGDKIRDFRDQFHRTTDRILTDLERQAKKFEGWGERSRGQLESTVKSLNTFDRVLKKTGSSMAAGIAVKLSVQQTRGGDGVGLGHHPPGTPGAMMNWAIGKYDSGLHPTSGYRPGAVTTSGNTSLHSIPPPNNAWDFAGPASAMVSAARGLAGKFGSGMRELIHTPLGFGIKNGSRVPLSFWGPTVNAMHYDHVHAARHGFHGVVRQPTLILAGEAGRERVDISPKGEGAGYVVNVNVYGDWSDLDNFERRVSAALNRAVRRRQR